MEIIETMFLENTLRQISSGLDLFSQSIEQSSEISEKLKREWRWRLHCDVADKIRICGEALDENYRDEITGLRLHGIVGYLARLRDIQGRYRLVEAPMRDKTAPSSSSGDECSVRVTPSMWLALNEILNVMRRPGLVRNSNESEAPARRHSVQTPGLDRGRQATRGRL